MTTTSHDHEHRELPPPSVEEVAPGVWAYVQPDGTWFINNCGFVSDGGQTVVIDATSTEARTNALIEAIAATTSTTATTLVNTHHHGDHTHGNYLFEGATIVAHRACREVMVAAGEIADYSAAFPGVEWGPLQFAPPTATFAGSLELYAGSVAIELSDLGHVAHTTGDIVAWIPSHRVLFSGDLVFHGGTPFALFGSVQGTIDAMDRLAAFDAAVLVPGHGPVAHGTEAITAALDDQREYFAFVQAGAAEGTAAGRSPIEQARTMDLGRFGSWTDSERLVGNLHVAYREAGENPGFAIDAGIVDMIAFNGGALPRCLA